MNPSTNRIILFMMNSPPIAIVNILTAVLLLDKSCINTASIRMNILIIGNTTLSPLMNNSTNAFLNGANDRNMATTFCISICILAANNCIF